MARAQVNDRRAAKPGTKLTKRQLQGEESRRHILDAAITLFSTHGYAGTTISQLSQACGLPVSSIYWHFGSKSGVLWAVAERGAAQFLETMPRASDFEGDPIERLEQMLRGVATAIDDGAEFFRLVLILTLTEHVDDEAAKQAAGHVRELALERWREAMRGIFAPDGDRAGRDLADELAVLGRAVAMGAFATADSGHDYDRFQSLLLLYADLVRARAQERLASRAA